MLCFGKQVVEEKNPRLADYDLRTCGATRLKYAKYTAQLQSVAHRNIIDHHMQKVETVMIFSPVLPPSSVMAVLLSVALLAAPLLGVVPLHRGSRGSLRDDTHMTSALGGEG